MVCLVVVVYCIRLPFLGNLAQSFFSESVACSENNFKFLIAHTDSILCVLATNSLHNFYINYSVHFGTLILCIGCLLDEQSV